MSARTAQDTGTAAGCFLLVVIIYLVIGLVVYAAAYGEPQGISLAFFLVVVLWPGALIYWSFAWIFYAIVFVLACLGIKHLWDGL